MIKNLTYRDPASLAAVEGIVGPELSFWGKLKSGGTSSPRFMISSASVAISKHLIRAHNLNYSTIDLRPGGIIVNFYSVIHHYVWVISFGDLVIENFGDSYKIMDEHNYVRYSPKMITKSNHVFMNRILMAQQRNHLGNAI